MKQVVIMPGGFHPFHAGHYALYQQAQKAFPGADVYVAATNDTSARPFPFAVKEKLAKLAGVAPGHFVQVKSPFRAEEITANYNPEDTQLIFVRSEKDAAKPPQAGGVKKDGSPAYLQPLLGAKKLDTFNKHAYMAYLPTKDFSDILPPWVNEYGDGWESASKIRAVWPQLNGDRKIEFVMGLYPRTQGNPRLAATVVKILDTAIGIEPVAEADDYRAYFKRPDPQTTKPEEKRYQGFGDYYNQAQAKSGKINTDKIRELFGKKQPEPELEEARIITPNSLVNVFYKPKQGTKVVQVARRVPADKAKKVIDTYVYRHATTPGMSRIYPSDFEMQVAGPDQYTINEDTDYIEEKNSR